MTIKIRLAESPVDGQANLLPKVMAAYKGVIRSHNSFEFEEKVQLRQYE